MKLPKELHGKIWHTTSIERYRLIIRDGAIMSEPPTVKDSERWKTEKGPYLYPYVRVIGGVSLFDFRGFDENDYSEKYPLSSWSIFVPRLSKWHTAVWIEIDIRPVVNNLIFGQALVDQWKEQKAYKHTIMPIIEVAHIGPLPVEAFRSILISSKENPSIRPLEGQEA